MRLDVRRRDWLPIAAAFLLTACSGGGGGGGSTSTPATPATPSTLAVSTQPSSADAARLLTQATYGPDDASIAAVTTAGYAAWISQQTALALTAPTHVSFVDARLAALKTVNVNSQLSANEFEESVWAAAATAPDQLRQRMKLALSEIFVISLQDTAIDVRGAASYYDMLGTNAFANFRTLLQAVTLHPMMGVYLTDIANQKENLVTGQHPDENYAREVMQLMTIGLYQLNMDGSRKLDGAGQPIATYTSDDISGLAKVFTGFSWYSPTPTNSTFLGSNKDPNATITPMIAYPSFHSISAKTFLGVTIPASTSADPAGDLKIALDTLFNHPNTPPFIAKQLIQRFVTSNPSPAYIQRVATVFADNGAGMTPDVQRQAFDPFFTTRRNEGGTGLGLAICRRLVELLDGRIGVDSQPSHGSTFWFWLPACLALPAATLLLPRAALAGRTLLVADDNATCRRVLREIVSPWGLRVTEAGKPFVRLAAAAFDAYLHGGKARHSVAV
jgi:CheY-like chemotaxis protein